MLPHLLGMNKHEDKAAEVAKAVPPSYVDVPEMIANLNGTHKPSYVKLAPGWKCRSRRMWKG